MDAIKHDEHYRSLYSFSEYADLMGYSRNQISLYARNGKLETIPCFATKRFYVIDSEENSKFIESLDKKRKARGGRPPVGSK
jgi:hypothetical protein